MDPLTDILTGLHIRQALFTRLDATAPWGVDSPGEPLVKFVLLTQGAAILNTSASTTPIALNAGDVFIMLDEQAYSLRDHPDSPVMCCADVEALRAGNRIGIGGGGALTSFISGAFPLDALEAGPLLKALPPLLHLRLKGERCVSFHSVLDMLALETGAPGLGSDAVVSRLFELMFVHAVRAYARQPDGPTRGWLAAIADRHLSRSMEAMHGDPAAGWTVASLAKEAGMSRSTFAARFKDVVGQAPLEYLTQWRVYCARRLLLQPNAVLADVSRQVGYESQAAFNRVFRRETAMTPGAFRKAHHP